MPLFTEVRGRGILGSRAKHVPSGSCVGLSAVPKWTSPVGRVQLRNVLHPPRARRIGFSSEGSGPPGPSHIGPGPFGSLTHSREWAEGTCSELRVDGVLRSSPHVSNSKQRHRYAVWVMCQDHDLHIVTQAPHAPRGSTSPPCCARRGRSHAYRWHWSSGYAFATCFIHCPNGVFSDDRQDSF
jgi:hypothetical protein